MSTLPSNSSSPVTRRLIADGCFKRPIYLIDIGARRGLDSRWSAFGTLVQAVGFEPDADECSRLNALGDSRIRYIPTALGDARRRTVFYNRQNPDASGYVPFPVPFYQRFVGGEGVATRRETHIELDSLDGLWPLPGAPMIDFIKIDAEGAEVDILKGAVSLLSNNRLLGAEIETRFFHFGEQGKFCDIDKYMRTSGLELFDISPVRHSRWALPAAADLEEATGLPTRRGRGQVIASDILYLRDLVAERRAGREFRTADGDEILILAALFEAYELYDCMAELLLEFGDLLSERTGIGGILDLIAATACHNSSAEALRGVPSFLSARPGDRDFPAGFPQVTSSSALAPQHDASGIMGPSMRIWHAQRPPAYPEWLGFRFEKPLAVRRLFVQNQDGHPERSPTALKLDAHVGDEWLTILNIARAQWRYGGEWQEWPVERSVSSPEFRLRIFANNGDPDLLTVQNVYLAP